MNVSTLCLAVLSTGDAAGYDIRKHVTEGVYSHFLDASFGSIYPALSRMETDQLVTSRTETTAGKPARKVYSITEEGRDAFLEALHRPIRKDVYRSEFLLLAMFAAHLQPAHVRAAIDAQLAFLRSEIETIDETAASIESPAAHWVADCGRVCIQHNIDYIEARRGELEALAGTELGDPLPLAAE